MTDAQRPVEGETGFDRVLAFTVPGQDARGRIVRLGPVLEAVLWAHDYPPPMMDLLAEALVVTALLGSQLKDDSGQLTFQVQAEGGAVDLLVCDYRKGELRGYVSHDAARLDALGASPSLRSLFGEGYLAITFDLATTAERYQGIAPIEGNSLAEACEAYLSRSEQIPSLLRVAVQSQGDACVAGGMLLQHLPKAEGDGPRLHVEAPHLQWEHISTMGGSVRDEELLDPGLSLQGVVWRLFHQEEEVRVDPREPLERGCRCSAAYYESVLSRFPETERADMRGDDGLVGVDCAFCSKIFKIAV